MHQSLVTCPVGQDIERVTSNANQRQTKEQKKYEAEISDHKAQVEMAWYAKIGVLLGIFGSILLYWTLSYTRDAATAANETLKIAKETLADTRENTRRELRAYLSVQNVKIMGKVSTSAGANDTLVTFDVVNSGQTPAYNVTASIWALGIHSAGLGNVVLCEKWISSGGFSQVHNGVLASAEYEGTDIDFDKMVVTKTAYIAGTPQDVVSYIPNSKISLAIRLEYYDTFSVGSSDKDLRFKDIFLYSQFLPAADSKMWPEAMSEADKKII